MCGIAGSFGRPISSERLTGALRALGRRGPDSSGAYEARCRGQTLNLVHTRLSIIDLNERANQPFLADDCALVFNGEIYNYVELRAELSAQGVQFVSESDTEVIIRAYRAWGQKMFDKLEGMWAFALHDRRSEKLLLSRDPFGEKPLFYCWDGETLLFASETNALFELRGYRGSVDTDKLRRYLVQGYRTLFKQSGTYFNEVKALPAATYAFVDYPATVEPVRYWDLQYKPISISPDEAVEETRRLFRRAISLRLRSDVPIAVMLSGGIDSGAIACAAAVDLGADVHTYSIFDKDPRYDEARRVRLVTDRLGRDTVGLHTEKVGLPFLQDLIAYSNAPVTTISFVLQSMLTKAIHGAGMRVALGGYGSDEIFAGYYDHYSFWLAEMADREDIDRLVADWRAGYGSVVRNPFLKDPMCFRTNPEARHHFSPQQKALNALLIDPVAEPFEEENYSDNLLRRRMLNEIKHETIPIQVHDGDLASMRWSVENRNPFMDRELAQFLFSVPNHMLIENGRPKWLLRAAVEGSLPDEIRMARTKQGFNSPISSMLDITKANAIEVLLSDGPIFDIVDRSRLEVFLDRADDRNSFSKFAFSFLSARLFLDYHHGGNSAEGIGSVPS